MKYWIIVDDHHDGPFSASHLVENGLQPETLVWTEGLADWTPAGDIAELAAMINSRGACCVSPTAERAPQESPVAHQEDLDGQQPQNSLSSETVVEELITTSDPVIIEQIESTEVHPQDAQPQEAIPHTEFNVNPAACAAVQSEPCPPAYIAWAIIATLLCCTIVGIPAIIFASMTKGAYYKGNIEKAKKYSEWTQWFIIASIVLGCVSWPFQIAVMGMF